MSSFQLIAFATLLLTAGASAALADDAADVARERQMPVPVVKNVFAGVDAFYASPQAPGNRLTSGTFKQLTLKAVRDRMNSLGDAQPGSLSEASDEESTATYHVAVRTTRHDSSETRECVENKVQLDSTEGVPAIKDGAFIIDTDHPLVRTWGWTMTFCRTVGASGGHSAWQLATAR